MKKIFRKKLLAASLMATGSTLVVPTITIAQTSNAPNAVLEEVVVSARRRDESIQEVPVTINAVTAEQIDQLNIRKFEELQGVVPGLTLQEDSIAASASIRGVRFDTFASGNNPTVEFYLNDAPISSLSVMQAMFDIGQIEVLRGPQGTLRGRASPSGSITITTQPPVMDEFGGYVDLTATNLDGQNARAALNAPIIKDKLALRVAGFWEENNINDVKNLFTRKTSEYKGEGYRLSLAFRPIESLDLNVMYQKVEPDRSLYFPVESANIADPNATSNSRRISASDRLSVQDTPEKSDTDLENLVFDASWQFADQALKYVYSRSEQSVNRQSPFGLDVANAVDGNNPADAWQGLYQQLNTATVDKSHEIRLQSVQPLFDDKLNYIVGFFYKENTPSNNVINSTPLAYYVPSGGGNYNLVGYGVSATPIYSGGESEEKSYFINLSYALTPATEISAGIRHITFEEDRNLIVGGTKLIGAGNVFGAAGDDGHNKWDKDIYSFSLKHSFTEEMMAYFSYGTSWRPGINAVGDFSLLKSDLQESFQVLPPEKSESFELGIRSTWLDQRLRLNASIFHQKFDNYPYRAGGNGVNYISYAAQRDNLGQVIGLTPELLDFNFVAAVPVEVDGIEVEALYKATDRWDLGAVVSYAKGKIDGGFVPCNDYLPNDGKPDSGGGVPNLGDVANATGGLFAGDNVTGCSANFRSNNAPLWTSTLTSQYNFNVGSLDAYVRGMWTFYGESDNDPTYSNDDVDAYDILNLFVGIGDPDGVWQVMLYGKNILDTEEVIKREANPGSLNFTGVDVVAQASNPALAGSAVSDYREIGLTAPREFGINLRYNF